MDSVDFGSIFSPSVTPPPAQPAVPAALTRTAAPPAPPASAGSAASLKTPSAAAPSAPLLHSTAPAGTAAARPVAATRANSAAAKPVAAPARAAPAQHVLRSQGVSSVMMMQLASSPFEAAPVLEQAAILFANGSDLEAHDALLAALKQGQMPPAAAREGWMLLFDVLENLGHRDQFDSAAIDFAVTFETSPPAFNDRSGVKDPMLETDGGQYVALKGMLDGSAVRQLDELAAMSARSRTLRIEFGKIEAIAGAGCTLLLDHLRSFKKSGHDLVFSSVEHLIGLLNGAIETGRRTDPEVYWLLLLELYQFVHMQAAHEEAALNYCVTYEVSPPQWQEPVRPAASTPSLGAVSLQVPQDAFYVKGTLRGDTTALFGEMNVFCVDKSLAVIDLFDLRRIDVAAAGEFINVITSLYMQGRQIEIRSPSPLIATLFVSMGFTEQARFTQRGA